MRVCDAVGLALEADWPHNRGGVSHAQKRRAAVKVFVCPCRRRFRVRFAVEKSPLVPAQKIGASVHSLPDFCLGSRLGGAPTTMFEADGSDRCFVDFIIIA